MEFSRPEYWYRFPSPGDLPNPGLEPRSPILQVDSLPAEPPKKPKNIGVGSLSLLQRIFLTQEWKRGLLLCRWILYQLSYQGSPFYFKQQGNQHTQFSSSRSLPLQINWCSQLSLYIYNKPLKILSFKEKSGYRVLRMQHWNDFLYLVASFLWKLPAVVSYPWALWIHIILQSLSRVAVQEAGSISKGHPFHFYRVPILCRLLC